MLINSGLLSNSTYSRSMVSLPGCLKDVNNTSYIFLTRLFLFKYVLLYNEKYLGPLNLYLNSILLPNKVSIELLAQNYPYNFIIFRGNNSKICNMLELMIHNLITQYTVKGCFFFVFSRKL